MDRAQIIFKHTVIILFYTIVIAVILLLLGLILLGIGNALIYIAQVIKATGFFLRDLIIEYYHNTGQVSLQYRSLLGLIFLGGTCYYFSDTIKQKYQEFKNNRKK